MIHNLNRFVLRKIFLLTLVTPLAAQSPNGTIFFTEANGSTPLALGSVSFSGADLVSLVDNEAVTDLGFALDRQHCHLYYAVVDSSSAGHIVRVNLNGTDPQSILVNPYPGPYPRGIVLDSNAQRLYWFTRSGVYRIHSCKLDGTDQQEIVPYDAVNPSVSPIVLQVDSVIGKMYWYDGSYGGFRRCNLDGSQIEDLLIPSSNVASVDIDLVNGFFYWTDHMDLYRAPVDGSSAPVVILQDTDVFMPSTGKYLDVEPSMDLITWVVSGGRIHSTSLSTPGAIRELPTFQGVQPSGSLEVLPGPRVGLSITPETVSIGGNVTLEVCGAQPNGAFAVFLDSWNGVSRNRQLYSSTTNSTGQFTLPVTLPANVGPGTAELSVIAADVYPQSVTTLPVTLTIQ